MLNISKSLQTDDLSTVYSENEVAENEIKWSVCNAFVKSLSQSVSATCAIFNRVNNFIICHQYKLWLLYLRKKKMINWTGCFLDFYTFCHLNKKGPKGTLWRIWSIWTNSAKVPYFRIVIRVYYNVQNFCCYYKRVKSCWLFHTSLKITLGRFACTLKGQPCLKKERPL